MAPPPTPPKIFNRERCPSCGMRTLRAYCSECGERCTHPDDLKLRTLTTKFLGGSLNLESTFWRSLRLLLFRPGQLTLDQSQGRRVGAMRLAQLFLFCNVLFFFAQPFTLTSTLDVSLDSHLEDQLYSEWASSRAQGYLSADSETQQSAREAFALRSSELTRSLVVVLVPMMALVFWVALWPLPRNAGTLLLLGFEFTSFLLLAILTVGMLAMRLFYSAFGDPTIGDSAFMRSRQPATNLLALVLTVSWTVIAVHRLAASHWSLSLIRGTLAAVAIVIPYWTFRFLIFVLAGSSL